MRNSNQPSAAEQARITDEAASRLSHLAVSLLRSPTNPRGLSDVDTAHYLARLTYLLFAEDSGIIEQDLFARIITELVDADGSNLGDVINDVFLALDTEDRTHLDIDPLIQRLTYVNGGLFADRTITPAMNRGHRTNLLFASDFDWSNVTPHVFGTMFQNVMSDESRHEKGQHYTEADNIRKTYGPLFLDRLKVAVRAARGSAIRLQELHDEVADMVIFDPACGSGNFLSLAYDDLRWIEADIIDKKHYVNGIRSTINLETESRVNVSQFHGIEIDPVAADIALVAMHITDHKVNREIAEMFEQEYKRIPIPYEPNIVCANALTMDWRAVCPNATYIIGNPPYLGRRGRTSTGSVSMTDEQRRDLNTALDGVEKAGKLDLIAGWYVKAAAYGAPFAFVSTNSIVQGEQVAPLFGHLFDGGWRIAFAHQSFPWANAAPGEAAVHVIITGLDQSTGNALLWDADGTLAEVDNISPYLAPGPSVIVTPQAQPIAADLTPGKQGRTTVTDTHATPTRASRPYGSGGAWINGTTAWTYSDVPSMTDAAHQVALAPATSSERRRYLPIAVTTPDVVTNPGGIVFGDDDGIAFAILSSSMLMAWQRLVGGRMKADLRFGNTTVYNTFPLRALTDQERVRLAEAGQGVLDARTETGGTLADLYDPDNMPTALRGAHDALDVVLDRIMAGAITFNSTEERQAFLLGAYERMTAEPIEESEPVTAPPSTSRQPTSAREVRSAVFAMNDGKCVGRKRGRACNRVLDPFAEAGAPNAMHVDHVVPRSLHGIDHMSNYQPLCAACNLAKGNRNTLDYRTAAQRAMYPAPTAPAAVIVEDKPQRMTARRTA